MPSLRTGQGGRQRLFVIATILVALGASTFAGPAVAGPSFSVGATAATPSPVAPGVSTTITTTVINTGSGASAILVDLEVYGAGGVRMFQQWTSGLTFAAGQPRTLQWIWPVTADRAAGTYTIKIGVFSNDWSQLYTWSNNAGTVTVGTASPASFALSVGRSGSGTGVVTSAPAGISCGADCTEAYASGTLVTLTASPAAGSTFAGWSGGGCAGTGACTVSLAGATSVAAAFAATVTAPASGLPPLPAGWPARLELGLTDGPGGASALRAAGPFRFRYQYLSGGVNTGAGWATWNANGSFVTGYVQESVQNGQIPVFSYYMLVHSSPGNGEPEAAGIYTNLQDRATMQAFYEDLRLFFQRAGAFPASPVVLHVEPDLWGYMQLRGGDDASLVPAQVAATGVAELAGLPDTVAGVARAVVRLRDTYARNVILAYPISAWGTGVGFGGANLSDSTVDASAGRAARFFLSLQAPLDIAFAELSDRDAGYYQYHVGDGGAAWWDAADYASMARFLAGFVRAAGKRVVMWQVPLGNTRMRAMNNTWGHYQDNRVEWFLDDPTRTHLAAYVQAGVVAFLFGGGAVGTTCACDAMGDGPTDPPAINGNTGVSLSAADDGGFFHQKAAAYYAAGAIPLAP